MRRPRTPFHALLCASFLIAGSATAHAQLTVGPAGSGAAYQEIQAAIDAASPGERIYFEYGEYDSIVISKPLTLIGVPSDAGLWPIIRSDAQASQPAITVRDIGAGDEVRLSSAVARRTWGDVMPVDGIVNVRNCAGRIVFADFVIGRSDGGATVTQGDAVPAAQIEDCAAVFFDRVTIDGVCSRHRAWGDVTACSVVDSHVWAVASSFEGGMYKSFFGSSLPDGSPGLRAVGSTIRLSRCAVMGTRSTQWQGISGLTWFSSKAGPGIELTTSTLHVDGGPGNSILGGQLASLGPPKPSDGVVMLGDSLTVYSDDALIQSSDGLTGDLGAAAITMSGPSNVAIPLDHAVPTLVADAPRTTPGSTRVLELSGSPNALHHVFMSSSTVSPVPFPSVEGDVALDLTAIAVVASVPSGPSGIATLPVSVPPSPLLVGSVTYYQGIETGAGARRLSNLATLFVVP